MALCLTKIWNERPCHVKMICGRQQPVSSPTLLLFFRLIILPPHATPAPLVSWLSLFNILGTPASEPLPMRLWNTFLLYLHGWVPYIFQAFTPISYFFNEPFSGHAVKMTLPGFYSLLFPHPLISYHFPACYIFYLFCSIFSWDSKLHDGKDPCLFCILPHPKCPNSAWHLIHNNNKTYPLQVNEYIPSDGHLKLNLYKSLQTEAHRDCAGLRIGFYNKLIQQVF